MNILQALRNTSLKMKEYVDKHIVKLESGDVVVKESEHSSTADAATNATNAENAVNAENAKEAEHAASADEATHSTNADHAATADSSTKTEQDGNGNVISDTYETKTDAETKLTEAKEYTDSAIEAIPSDAFVVNVTSTTVDKTTTYSADKTFEEITEAYNDGKHCVAIIDYNSGARNEIYPLTALANYTISFSVATGNVIKDLVFNSYFGTITLNIREAFIKTNTYSDLTTTDKTIVGAINELNTNKANTSDVESTYETKEDASAKLEEAKGYADTKVANLVFANDEEIDNIFI